MKVTKDKVVSMHYTLKNDAGDVIDSSEGKETMDFLQGHGNIIPGLETALRAQKKGTRSRFLLSLNKDMALKWMMQFKKFQELPYKESMK